MLVISKIENEFLGAKQGCFQSFFLSSSEWYWTVVRWSITLRLIGEGCKQCPQKGLSSSKSHAGLG